jgi:hypothetical protein
MGCKEIREFRAGLFAFQRPNYAKIFWNAKFVIQLKGQEIASGFDTFLATLGTTQPWQ